MNTTFMIAVILLAAFVGASALLGLFVIARVFMSAYALKQRLGNLPAQLEARQRALNQAQAQIVEQQRALAKEKIAEAQAAKAQAEAPK